MDLRIKAYSCLCELEKFEINGVKASYLDFGDKEDVGKSREYGVCKDMQFIPIFPTDEILHKYHITLSDYKEVCDALKEKLHFGHCGYCA